MLCNAYNPSSLESRRREISELLEEIRAPLPTPTEIIKAIEQASGGQLSSEHLDRIATDIHSLYRAR
jgi:hypothetical protein